MIHLFRREGENRLSARSTKRIAREAKPATVIVKRRPGNPAVIPPTADQARLTDPVSLEKRADFFVLLCWVVVVEGTMPTRRHPSISAQTAVRGTTLETKGSA